MKAVPMVHSVRERCDGRDTLKTQLASGGGAKMSFDSTDAAVGLTDADDRRDGARCTGRTAASKPEVPAVPAHARQG